MNSWNDFDYNINNNDIKNSNKPFQNNRQNEQLNNQQNKFVPHFRQQTHPPQYIQPQFQPNYQNQPAPIKPNFENFPQSHDAMGNNKNIPNSEPSTLNREVASMAYMYSGRLATQGKQYFENKVNSFVPIETLKSYFTVDSAYVYKKCSIILFPYCHNNWTISPYRNSNADVFNHDINAPDLYIPALSFFLYIMLSCIFTTAHGISIPKMQVLMSSTLAWLIVEIFVYIVYMYIANIKNCLAYLDLIAYSSYKLFPMSLCSVVGYVFGYFPYMCCLVWCSCATRSLKLALSNQPNADTIRYSDNRTKIMYMLLLICIDQPLIIWLLTRSSV
ncbi:hypothetical protein A3Q56_05808 [Intoshia linei]|uniref:Protein YIF1 n=1 Tax=Intoshia linei TaxID=1819745 RepID=A0A177AY34_9BILA|nr:hypothetical protein A3Q56_05808 [Intoshia linei]